MRKRCVIIGGAPLDVDPRDYVREGDYVICADRGWIQAEEAGIVPDMIVGDFDSSPNPSGRYDNVTVLPVVKDDTDTHHIARYAVENGFTDVLLLGGVGGKRVEHTFANVATMLFLAENGISATALTRHSTMIVIVDGRISLEPSGRRFFSVFPLGVEARGVSIRNAKYELSGADIRNDYPLGVSNEFSRGNAEIEVAKGSLLVIASDKD